MRRKAVARPLDRLPRVFAIGRAARQPFVGVRFSVCSVSCPRAIFKPIQLNSCRPLVNSPHAQRSRAALDRSHSLFRARPPHKHAQAAGADAALRPASGPLRRRDSGDECGRALDEEGGNDDDDGPRRRRAVPPPPDHRRRRCRWRVVAQHSCSSALPSRRRPRPRGPPRPQRAPTPRPHGQTRPRQMQPGCPERGGTGP